MCYLFWSSSLVGAASVGCVVVAGAVGAVGSVVGLAVPVPSVDAVSVSV